MERDAIYKERKGYHMSVAGLGNGSVTDTYTVYNTTEKEKTAAAGSTTNTEKTAEAAADKTATSSTATDKANSNSAAIYDKTKLSEDDRKAIVAQLKADQEKRQTQMTNLVRDMLSKQTNAYGAANNIWQFLAKGNYTVDAATQKKAQEDISEDGYWGVKQTSDRIVSFATALAGNDSKQLEKMRDAFLKGYKQAEKTWGGKLPDISQKTYDAVLEKFDDLLKPSTETAGTANNSQNTSQPSSTVVDKVTTTEDGTVVAKIG